MARRPIVIANWKMNKTREEAVAFALEMKAQLPDLGAVDVGVAPPTPVINSFAEKLKATEMIVLGQNMHWESSGAFTGEVSSAMLHSVGASGVIIGHSERRQYFGETDEMVAKKVERAFAADLLPVVCVGETLEQRKGGKTHAVVERQIRGALSGVNPEQLGNCVIAYEPIWAIGTGETATPEQAQEVHALIRALVEKMSARHVAEALRIQYGGSVKPATAAALMAQPDIDGALVGGASLQVGSFTEICTAAG